MGQPVYFLPNNQSLSTRQTVLFLPLADIFADMLAAAFGNGNAARAHVLQHALELLQRRVERLNILRQAAFGDNGVGGVHLDNVGVVNADLARNALLVEHCGRRNLEQAALLYKYLIVSEIVGLKDVDFLFNLTGDFVDSLLVAVAGNGVFVDTLNA